MEKAVAIKIKKRVFAAVAELDGIVSDIRGYCSEEEFQVLKRAVGLSIGKIATDILEPTMRQFPEIDDLK